MNLRTQLPLALCLAGSVVPRSDNRPEFVAYDLRKWLANTGAKTMYIEHGSTWESGYCRSFNSKMRDEFLTARSSTR
jgi:transposase InsO family protein